MAVTLLQGVTWPEPSTRSSHHGAQSLGNTGMAEITCGKSLISLKLAANHLDFDLPSSSGLVSCKGRSLFLPAALQVLVLETLPLDRLCCRFNRKGLDSLPPAKKQLSSEVSTRLSTTSPPSEGPGQYPAGILTSTPRAPSLRSFPGPLILSAGAQCPPLSL
ncbi:hypothetical protein CapIbe_019259 [Capra ibex]